MVQLDISIGLKRHGITDGILRLGHRRPCMNGFRRCRFDGRFGLGRLFRCCRRFGLRRRFRHRRSRGLCRGFCFRRDFSIGRRFGFCRFFSIRRRFGFCRFFSIRRRFSLCRRFCIRRFFRSGGSFRFGGILSPGGSFRFSEVFIPCRRFRFGGVFRPVGRFCFRRSFCIRGGLCFGRRFRDFRRWSHFRHGRIDFEDFGDRPVLQHKADQITGVFFRDIENQLIWIQILGLVLVFQFKVVPAVLFFPEGALELPGHQALQLGLRQRTERDLFANEGRLVFVFLLLDPYPAGQAVGLIGFAFRLIVGIPRSIRRRDSSVILV